MPKLKLEMLPLQTSANTVTFQTDMARHKQRPTGGLTLQVLTRGDTDTGTHIELPPTSSTIVGQQGLSSDTKSQTKMMIL